eukprot:TRINITY_DN21194_c1_g2_i1.p1 TRINITY_DN21194_c1_g2~~TRINITY_DN21194_c1_g2_i1.p1  ORF type:complete len:539 (+),score=51.35 TRINITY_DN21194_c1_g2_i1:50-1666(+)
MVVHGIRGACYWAFSGLVCAVWFAGRTLTAARRFISIDGENVSITQYAGPDRIVKACRFLGSWSDGDLSGEYYPNKPCPNHILETWQCYAVCLEDAGAPGAGFTRQIAPGKTGWLRSWSFEISGVGVAGKPHTEGGEFTFLPDIKVDYLYAELFEPYHQQSAPCDQSPYGTQAIQQYLSDHAKSRMNQAPDNSGVRHCARAGCVPATGGWNVPGECRRTNWRFEKYLLSGAEEIDAAISMIKLPVNSMSVVHCKYALPSTTIEDGERMSYHYRLVEMTDRPFCEYGTSEAWKCFEMCPGHKYGYVRLVDAAGEFIDDGLVRPVIRSEVSYEGQGKVGYLKGFTVDDTSRMQTREFTFFKDLDVDGGVWDYYFQNGHHNSETSWTELLEGDRTLPEDANGWTMKLGVKEMSVKVHEHLENAARLLSVASVAEAPKVELFQCSHFLEEALRAMVDVTWGSQESKVAKDALAKGTNGLMGPEHWSRVLKLIAACMSNTNEINKRAKKGTIGVRTSLSLNQTIDALKRFVNKVKAVSERMFG